MFCFLILTYFTSETLLWQNESEHPGYECSIIRSLTTEKTYFDKYIKLLPLPIYNHSNIITKKDFFNLLPNSVYEISYSYCIIVLLFSNYIQRENL